MVPPSKISVGADFQATPIPISQRGSTNTLINPMSIHETQSSPIWLAVAIPLKPFAPSPPCESLPSAPTRSNSPAPSSPVRLCAISSPAGRLTSKCLSSALRLIFLCHLLYRYVLEMWRVEGCTRTVRRNSPSKSGLLDVNDY